MCFDCSLVVQRPWVLILLQTAPQPFLEASHVISISILPCEIGLLDYKTLSTHQPRSALAAGDKHIMSWQFPLAILRAMFLSISRCL